MSTTKRASHAAAKAAQPVAGLELLAQQGQQAGQVAGEAGGDEHQRQVGLSGPRQLAHHPVDGPLQRGIAGQSGATPGDGLARRHPGEGGETSHGRTLSPWVLPDNGAFPNPAAVPEALYRSLVWLDVRLGVLFAVAVPLVLLLWAQLRREGAVLRLRPKVMTVSTVIASLLPIMWSTSTGAEVMKPIAAPVIGGMVSSLLHILIVTPVIFFALRSREIFGRSRVD